MRKPWDGVPLMDSIVYPKPRFLPVGDAALCVELGNVVDRSVNDRVLGLFNRLRALSEPGILDLVPSYRSLLIHYDPMECSHEKLLLTVERCLSDSASAGAAKGMRIEIPVCYGEELGPDLDHVAAFHGLTPEQVIDLHRAPVYRVCMIGFAPGQPYLGGLDERLFTPRLASPRKRVPAGSVGIADRQTGIYSIDSPGGWRLIGRTPLRLFDPLRASPFLLGTGDEVRFLSITRDAFESLTNP